MEIDRGYNKAIDFLGIIEQGDNLLEVVLHGFAEVWGLSSADLKKKCRKREYVMARYMYANYCMNELGVSKYDVMPYINLNRCSHLHSTRTHENEYSTNALYREKYEHVINQLSIRKWNR